MVRSQWEPFAAAVDALDVPVRRTILTHAHIDHVGGTKAFPNTAVYGSQQTSDVLDQRDADRRVQGVHARVRRGVRRPRRARHPRASPTSSDGAAQLTPRIEVLPAEGHTEGDLIVLVADADVCFAGDLCFFGVTPLAFQGNPAVWADVLDAVAELADVIVPGHGPVGGDAEVRELQGYLRACVDADGDVRAIPPGPWDAWIEREPRRHQRRARRDARPRRRRDPAVDAQGHGPRLTGLGPAPALGVHPYPNCDARRVSHR